MMLENIYPRTKSQLVRALQQMPIKKIEVIDGFVPANEHELIKAANEMSLGPDDVTIILVKS
jgi:isopropylmalate/homocitrate/citramalate synthase